MSEDIVALQKLGYSGQGITVGIVDKFIGEDDPGQLGFHGITVAKAIQVVAPHVIIVKQNIAKTHNLAHKNKQIDDFSVKALETAYLRLLPVDKIQETLGYYLADDYDKMGCHTDKFENITIHKDQILDLKMLPEGLYARISLDNKDYYVSFGQLFPGIHEQKFTILSDAPLVQSIIDDQVAQKLEKITQQGIKIINFSISFLGFGPKSKKVLDRLSEDGGILVKASGNAGLTIKAEFDVNNFKDLKDDSRFYSFMRSKGCLVIGALENFQNMATYTNRAGLMKDRFISAIVEGVMKLELVDPKQKDRANFYDVFNISGTSLAAPQITGVLALLQEAYPRCKPKVLAQAILASGDKMGTDEEGIIYGQGRMNAMAAFNLAKTDAYCNQEPVEPQIQPQK